MSSEKQYIDLYERYRKVIFDHSSDIMNAVRDTAFEDCKRQGFPSRKVERYRYTDIQEVFAPDYGLNLNRLDIPVNPYEAFKCDVPNLSTTNYFVVNDAFHKDNLPKAMLPDGVIVDSLRDVAVQNPNFIGMYYAKLAETNKDAVTALNTMLAQDGLFVYVPKGVKPYKLSIFYVRMLI